MRFWKSCRIVFSLVDGAWPLVLKGHSYVGGREQAAHARPRSSKKIAPRSLHAARRRSLVFPWQH